MIPTRAELEILYLEQHLSQSQIARFYGTYQTTVSEWFKNLGIKARHQGNHHKQRDILLPGSTPNGHVYPKSDCAHWWLIESPDGPTSKGVCKRCGEVREFRNGDAERPPVMSKDIHRSRGQEVLTKYKGGRM